MDNEVIIDFLKPIAAGRAKMTQKNKDRITELAGQYGIAVPTCGCRNKWIDVAMLVYKAVKSSETQSVDNTTTPHEISQNTANSGRFRYKKINPVTLMGVTYSQETENSVILALRRAKPAIFNQLYKEV